MKKVLWQELRRTEFQQAIETDSIVIVPVGSIEQHGNHLPVDTDSSACFSIAKRAAQAVDDFPVLVLPLIWTGYSTSHMAYPGTITLRHDTFVELLTDVLTSVHSNGFKKILILNGHGGNAFIVGAMRSKMVSEHDVSSVIAYTWWDIPGAAKALEEISEIDNGMIGHAGEMETSIQLYLQPELVDMKAAIWDRGVYGDPITATIEKGEYVINAAVKALVNLLCDWHSGKLQPKRGNKIFEGQRTIISKEEYKL